MTWNQVGDVAVLHPAGDLREGPQGDEIDSVLRVFARSGRRVIFDLTETDQLSARALGMLARACDEAIRHGGRVVLCGVNERQRWLLGITRLNGVLDIYDTPASAIVGLTGRQAVA
jgi:anti-anti-sigma factor